jgi:hypothetical protein
MPEEFRNIARQAVADWPDLTPLQLATICSAFALPGTPATVQAAS